MYVVQLQRNARNGEHRFETVVTQRGGGWDHWSTGQGLARV